MRKKKILTDKNNLSEKCMKSQADKLFFNLDLEMTTEQGDFTFLDFTQKILKFCENYLT